MWDVIVRGGIMMAPILLGSVLALAIVVERLWSLQRSRVLPAAFLESMQRLLTEGRREEALTACRQAPSALALVLAAGLENSSRPRAEIVEALEIAGRREAARLSRWVGALGAIAALEPLMGLLGTVLGLIAAFQSVEQLKVIGNPSIVAAGVWQALITTAAGLFVAIPAYALYRYLRARVSALTLELEDGAFLLVQRLTAGPGRARAEGGTP
ncbi:MAG TPA: MotA/TolQ/ExbB proton channel family protein [Myxococcota bacterium]|nr:MotA/TolQ/ExbB proton channel family protein [Myxococcota bacterium]HRY93887.1 MotA/TolQ/ExbB proton channel family protein [Myxococcota bacterium]HSA24821.1 MotA/TolQ/ExbB proton channel family protein [Myxococcota bacterium]